jgi:hypothetical protein
LKPKVSNVQIYFLLQHQSILLSIDGPYQDDFSNKKKILIINSNDRRQLATMVMFKLFQVLKKTQVTDSEGNVVASH